MSEPASPAEMELRECRVCGKDMGKIGPQVCGSTCLSLSSPGISKQRAAAAAAAAASPEPAAAAAPPFTPVAAAAAASVSDSVRRQPVRSLADEFTAAAAAAEPLLFTADPSERKSELGRRFPVLDQLAGHRRDLVELHPSTLGQLVQIALPLVPGYTAHATAEHMYCYKNCVLSSEFAGLNAGTQLASITFDSKTGEVEMWSVNLADARMILRARLRLACVFERDALLPRLE